MTKNIEYIHTDDNDPKWNMPYTPAIKVHSGKTVYVAGVTAAPVYHSHPHIQAEFDHIPEDAAQQAEMTMESLQKVLRAAGGELTDIVQLFRFIVDMDKNQDAINVTLARYFGDHRPVSTTVEIVRLATDPRLVLELAAVAIVPE
jgi:2-iminobutanoate/2-iminopropanoate deaminase